MLISRNHPLRRLFADLVVKELPGEREMVAYVGDLLIDFVHVDNLYRIRNCRGKRLEEVGEMLVESNPLLGAPIQTIYAILKLFSQSSEEAGHMLILELVERTHHQI